MIGRLVSESTSPRGVEGLSNMASSVHFNS